MAQKVLVIVGPTAVGKTDLSIKLAHLFNGEVISGDSMQVYQGLDVGTAKVTEREMDGIDHHLLNILKPDQPFSVADFVDNSKKEIKKIATKQHLPIIVGGTGLYIQALLDGFNLGSPDTPVGQDIRKELEKFAVSHGNKALWDRLEKVDPKAAQKIPVNNVRRVVRALEVYLQTGELFSKQNDVGSRKLDPLIIGLNTDRKLLYERINSRVEHMMDDGLLPEARQLYQDGGGELPAGKGIGYKELFPFFAGEAELEQCVELIKKNSRHYAKRQLTWFRNRMNVSWFDLVQNPQEIAKIEQMVTEWIK